MANSDALVVFTDEASSITQVFTQLISDAGAIGFGSAAAQVSSSLGSVHFAQPTCCTDMAGGWFVAWWERGSAATDWKIKLAHYNSSGVSSWTPVTVDTDTALPADSWPKLSPDREGGCFITWDKGNTNPYKSYINRYTNAGAVAFGWSATMLHSPTYTRCGFVGYPLVPGDGYVYVSYLNPHNSNFGTTTVWVHKFAIGSPAPLWGVSGVSVGVADTFHDTGEMIVSDGSGGLIVGLESSGVKLRRISSSGAVAWTTAKLSSSSSVGPKAIVSDGEGGAIVQWVDTPGLAVKAQRVNASGVAQWPSAATLQTGVLQTSYENNLIGVSDGDGGAIFVWGGDTSSPVPYVYVRRVASDGSLPWGSAVAPAVNATKQKVGHWMCTDGDGGCVVSWAEHVSGTQYDAYAMRIGHTGTTVWGPTALRSSTTRQYSTLAMFTNAAFGDTPIVIAPPASPDSRAGLMQNIRYLIDDLDKNDYAISSVKMVAMMNGAMQTIAARMLVPMEDVLDIDLVSGQYDYTLSGIPGDIRSIYSDVTGRELELMRFDDMASEFKQDTSNACPQGRPLYYAPHELSSQALKIRVAPTPSTLASFDTLKVRYSLIPNALSLETSTVPFPDVLLRAFERRVAAECVASMTQAQRDRRRLGMEQVRDWLEMVEMAIREENFRQRVASGSTQDRIVEVTDQWR